MFMPKMFYRAREPVSSYTHFLGAVCSVVITFVMLFMGISHPNIGWIPTISAVIFGLSLIALYFTSSYYHFKVASDQVIKRLRKLDHSMIYVLIAGTYTPMLLTFFPYPKAIWFTVGIWVVALLGIIIKVCWLTAPRWLYTSLYVLMGWSIVLDLPAIASAPTGVIILLLAGGISYTIGAVFYILKWPNFTKEFGFHEFFHLFIMLGSFFHILVVLLYIL